MAKKKSKKRNYNVADLLVIVGALVLIGLTATSLSDLTGYATKVTNYAAPKLVLSPNPVIAGQSVTAVVSGFKGVEEKTLYLRQGGCGESNYIYDYDTCPDSACNLKLSFKAPTASMIFPVYACIETGETPVGTARTSSAMVNLDVRSQPDLIVKSLTLFIKKGVDYYVPVTGSISLSGNGGAFDVQPEVVVENIGTSKAGLFDVTYSVPELNFYYASVRGSTTCCSVDTGEQLVLDRDSRYARFPQQTINKAGTYTFKVQLDEPGVRRDTLARGDFGDIQEFDENNNVATVKLVVTA